MLYEEHRTNLWRFINEISFGDLQKNAIKAAEHAGIREEDYENYIVITVEGYYNIAKIIDDFEPIEIDATVYPFDDKRIYPMQGIEKVIQYKRF